MTRVHSSWISLVAALGLLLVGCSGATHHGPLSPDDLQTKMMRYQQVNLHQRLFYVGIARSHNLQPATEQAYGEITRQLTWLPSGSQDMLEGLYRVDRTATDSDGSVHVLAVLDRESASNHLRRQRDENRRILGKEIVRCRQLLNAGESGDASDCIEKCSRQLKRTKLLHDAVYSAVGDPSSVYNPNETRELEQLKEKHAAVSTRKRLSIVHVLWTVDQRGRGNLNPKFQEVISAAGLKIVSRKIRDHFVLQALGGNTEKVSAISIAAGAGIAIAGKVNVRFIGSELGQYFAEATARLVVIDTESGRTLADLNPGPIKGGHISRDNANLRATDKAIQAAKVKLARVLQGLQ